MIVVSSFRPFGEDPEWDRNQSKAFRTWSMFAKRIVIFAADYHITYSGPKVFMCRSPEFPTIKEMVEEASKFGQEYICICNGDIMLNPQIMKIEQRMRFGNYRCASSRRWHFDPNAPMPEALEAATLTDQEGRDDRGRDVFIARWDVWGRIAKEIPDAYRIGHGRWDAYLTDKFREHWNDRFLDFTAFRYVHHPHHGGRRRPHDEAIFEAVRPR